MPLRAAASPRGRPSSTSARASMRRTCAPSVHLPASVRNSALLWSTQVTFNVAPISPTPPSESLARASNKFPPMGGMRPESQRQRGWLGGGGGQTPLPRRSALRRRREGEVVEAALGDAEPLVLLL